MNELRSVIITTLGSANSNPSLPYSSIPLLVFFLYITTVYVLLYLCFIKAQRFHVSLAPCGQTEKQANKPKKKKYLLRDTSDSVPWEIHEISSMIICVFFSQFSKLSNKAVPYTFSWQFVKLKSFVEKLKLVVRYSFGKITFSKSLVWELNLAINPLLVFSRYDRIALYSTFYGRDDNNTCQHKVLPSKGHCVKDEHRINEKLFDLCQGESKCSVAATSAFLGKKNSIMCPEVYKYARVVYRCIQHPKIVPVSWWVIHPSSSASSN